jgi:predicted ATPase
MPDRTLIEAGEIKLDSLTSVNIILGRNGAGKSRLLRTIDAELERNADYNLRYVSPERAGVFRKDGNTETNLVRDPQWLRNVRRKNQAENFKAASAYFLRDVELAYLRRLQNTPELRNDPERNFKTDRLEKINRLLSNISLDLEGASFVFKTFSGQQIPPDEISSGESEAVSLAAEILYFFETTDENKFNLLLLDEPDVHLHPDLQARLAQMIIEEVCSLSASRRENTAICLATHSTSLVCALASADRVSIGVKQFGVNSISFARVSDQLRKVAPFFGHPLSLCLSGDAMLILEGEDDERVWQQAARSAGGRIRLFPVLAETVDHQGSLEQLCSSLLDALYDKPIGYSVRDGDGILNGLTPVGALQRYRLNCYAIENCLLSDECLDLLGSTWVLFCQRATEWIAENQNHKDIDILSSLIASLDRMRHSKIKAIRNLICPITSGSNKPWEVVVGQAIARLDPRCLPDSSTSLADYIGRDAISSIISPAEDSVSPDHLEST